MPIEAVHILIPMRGSFELLSRDFLLGKLHSRSQRRRLEQQGTRFRAYQKWLDQGEQVGGFQDAERLWVMAECHTPEAKIGTQTLLYFHSYGKRQEARCVDCGRSEALVVTRTERDSEGEYRAD